MTDIVRLRTTAEIDDEAAAWVWRLDGGELSPSDRQAFEAWLRRDRRHRPAFEELGGVWRALDGLAEAKREEKIATFAEIPQQPRAPVSRWKAWSLGAAAMLAVVGLVTYAWYYSGNETQTLATAVGQQRSLSLADGSTVELNTNSTLQTYFVSARREVYLGKGEAHFDVAPDSRRPFEVHAGNAIVRALGTKFDVRVHDDRSFEVMVTEGRVEVVPQARVEVSGESDSAGSAPSASRHVLDAGQRLVSFDGDATVTPIDLNTAARTLAWRDGAVVFDGETLARAVAELNRYTESRFVVSDPALGELRIGGRYRIDDVEGIVRGLESALPVAIRRTDDGLIFIEPRH